ncbi:ABC transporter permease [Paraconexibacter antarcticus]|uniref:ABC transporter permease n=1 Tax=Paraconexibacter antarcticus TaxID=2949664 RepID=A0ABY5DYX2_9ACTN|nr:ABC transporter permease [Paraconexibacter antarcticus]UTI66745.1 ABC transporter permease [Paraconexibacter antarcticus]
MAPPAARPPRAAAWVARRRAMRGVAFEIGGMCHLAALVVARGLRPPFIYGAELLAQLRFVVTISWFPLVLTAFALSFGPAGIQASGFLGLFGALDRLGAAYELIVVREFAPLVTAIVVAGVAGTAICADLGAREVQEETDALRVLGVDPVKSLVVPRVIALVTVSLMFDVLALIAGMLGAVVVVLQNHAPLGPFFSTFFNNATPLELEASFLKAAIYGAVISIVCCYKGLKVTGGPEGVGRAVNHAVVICFLAIGAIDYVFTQLLLATNPILSQPR